MQFRYFPTVRRLLVSRFLFLLLQFNMAKVCCSVAHSPRSLFSLALLSVCHSIEHEVTVLCLASVFVCSLFFSRFVMFLLVAAVAVVNWQQETK